MVGVEIALHPIQVVLLDFQGEHYTLPALNHVWGILSHSPFNVSRHMLLRGLIASKLLLYHYVKHI